jgi:hypothetical protein
MKESLLLSPLLLYYLSFFLLDKDDKGEHAYIVKAAEDYASVHGSTWENARVCSLLKMLSMPGMKYCVN